MMDMGGRSSDLLAESEMISWCDVLLWLNASLLGYAIGIIRSYHANNEIYDLRDRGNERCPIRPPNWRVIEIERQRDKTIGDGQKDSWKKEDDSSHDPSAIHLSDSGKKE